MDEETPSKREEEKGQEHNAISEAQPKSEQQEAQNLEQNALPDANPNQEPKKENNDGKKDVGKKTRRKLIVTIAIIILILILAFATYAILAQKNAEPKQNDTSDIEAESSMQILPAEAAQKTIQIEAVYDKLIVLRNTGTLNITSSELTVYDNNTFVECNWTESVAKPMQVFGCTMPEKCQSGAVKVLAPGNSQVFNC
jgi:hypothetical protein